MKRVNLKDFSKELGDFTTASVAKMKQATSLGVARSIPDLVAASPVDTGLYAQSWHMTETETSAIVYNTAPHAAVIEHGARPFTPPIGPLLAWAKRVLTGQKDADGKTIQTGQPDQEGGYSSEVWALAIHTQKKIAAEGMLPKHVLENMIPTIIENIRREYEHLA